MYEPGPGSLENLLRALGGLEATAADLAEARGLPRPRVYPMRRMSQEFPAIYNWLGVSPGSYEDVSDVRHRLVANLTVRVAVGRIDSDELTARLLRYADVIRDVFDANFRGNRPLDNAAKWMDTPSMQLVTEQFGESFFPAVEFNVIAWLDRNVIPTP